MSVCVPLRRCYGNGRSTRCRSKCNRYHSDSGRIIGLCKFYIETARDAPSDLRLILVETSALKVILENLNFLTACDGPVSDVATQISSADGPIEGCLRAVTGLENLFPADGLRTLGQDSSKKRKLKSILTALAWPLKESKARKLLDEMARHKSTISLALTTDSIHDIKKIKEKALEIHDMLTESQRQGVYQWLCHTDPSPLHHRTQKNHETGTGTWMLGCPEWADWLAKKHRCLWIHGIPGAGKTVLMSYLIEQISRHCQQVSSPKITYVYYYCYFAHNQDEAKPFLKWLIGQLCRKAAYIPKATYDLSGNWAEPRLAELLEAVAQILVRFDTVYVALDAIDESSSQDDVLQVLKTLVTDPRFEGLRLITSSRVYVNIEKTMLGISTSISMKNPFVEQDIRRYVHSTLQANARFGRWPHDLLQEVEESVTAGAGGMFRWAVCQIDALQRLKCERAIVHNALKNLPKTLNEPYDRIVLAVPEEDRLFVEHALQWIAHYNELYDGEGIPYEILIQSAEASILNFTGKRNERFYDEDMLREVCGCLINISPEDYLFYISVNFAHYSVREYLDSTRAFDSTSGPSPSDETLKPHFIKLILSEALCIKPNDCWDLESNITDNPDVIRPVDSDYYVYCILSALLLLYSFPDQVCQQGTLHALAIKVSDPSMPHFDHTEVAVSVIEQVEEALFNRGIIHETNFLEISWRPDTSSELKHLYHLTLLTEHNPGCSPLIETFLMGKDIKSLLQARLGLERECSKASTWEDPKLYEINDPLINAYAQLSPQSMDPFKLLIEAGAGCFDPSVALLLSIAGHNHSDDSQNFCPVERLLELGADPNLRSYRTTALQIATFELDFDGVERLLKAGALPSDVGNPEGIVWGEHSILEYLNHLYGASPLTICREFDCTKSPWWREQRKDDRKKIEALLRRYGAEAFSETSGSDVRELRTTTEI